MSATIQAGNASPISMISAARTSTLSAIGSSSVPSGDESPTRRAHQPSSQSVAMATQNTAVPQ